MKNICVFCGARPGTDPDHLKIAEQLGSEVARRGLGLVYGGGRIGLMGAVANGALSAKGTVVGVIPEGLVQKEVAHSGLTDLRIVQTMHERKDLMEKMSHGFLALPGGFGTLDELCEIITWWQLGIHNKPIAIVNAKGYFDGLLSMIEHGVQSGFIEPHHLAGLVIANDPIGALEAIVARLS